MLLGLLRTMRPHQWVKNLFVLAPVVFAQQLFDVDSVLGALAGFLLFSLLASSVYIVNDIVDVEADRAHPVKRNRPIASGKLPIGVARVAFVTLAVLSLAAGWAMNGWLALTLLTYFVQNLVYCFWLKRVAYLDVMSIAFGFELRVIAGSLAAHVPWSTYLLLVTFLLALYLGFGKRMHEMVQAEAKGSGAKTRSVLRQYDRTTLSWLLFGTAFATIATYVVYTIDPNTRAHLGTDYLIVTTVFVLGGVLRFKHLVENRPEAESPTEEILKDWPFLGTLAGWAVAVLLVLYFT